MTEPEPDQLDPDRPLPPMYRRIKAGGAGSLVLGAAMIAVGEVLEPDKTGVEISERRDDPGDPDGLGLTFGPLPGLD